MAATMSFVKENALAFSRQKIDMLVSYSLEKSYRMPDGLTREQRREWAKTIRNKAQ